ncbi:MAG: hypothetical protein WAO19_00405 [Candidatus Kryptoniota bacterium]
MRPFSFPRNVFFFGLVLGLLVVGCKKNSSPTGPGSTGAINGYVMDIDGVPINAVSVIVKGKSPVITDANGAFSVSNVTTPYDIILVLSTEDAAVEYTGVTRTNPTLYYPYSLTTSKTATISGTVPAATGKTTEVFFVSGNYSWWTTADPNTGDYSITPSWKGSTNTLTGILYVLRWTSNTAGLPSQYDAYDFVSLTISAGGTFNNNNFLTTDLTDPPNQNISGSVSLPSTSYSLTEKDLYIDFGGAYVFIASETGASLTDNFSYNVPVVNGATFEVDAYASAASTPTNRTCYYWKTGIAAGASGVTVPLAVAPQLNLPANNGTGVDTTIQFLWAQGGGGGVYEFAVAPVTTGDGPTFIVITANTTANIPNLAPQGLGLPSNTSYEWDVTEYYPLSSVDSAASNSFVAFWDGNAGNQGGGQSEVFNFTTKVLSKTSQIVHSQAGRSSPLATAKSGPLSRLKTRAMFGK